MLGLCCQYMKFKPSKTSEGTFFNIIDERGMQYGQYLKGKYSSDYIRSIWLHNAKQLYSIIQRIYSEGIKVFRISSSTFPLYDVASELLLDFTEVKLVLAKIGEFVLSHNMRLTTHPDQFVVLSSNCEVVINNSIKMLGHSAWVFDQMHLPETSYYSINIHGGAKGNSNILINSIGRLISGIKNRLTLENDERSYSVIDLLKINNQTNVPICFDSHHHSLNDEGISIEDGLELCKSTWKDIKPLTHLSNSIPEFANGSVTERRKHSDYVYYIPECQLKDNNSGNIDIEMEFKLKNIAIEKAIKDFNLLLS